MSDNIRYIETDKGAVSKTSDVELYTEPLDIKNMLSDGAEMTDLQHTLLCGLIRKYKPKKLVEVGVAAGGTTTIILNCLDMLGMDTEVYSIDALDYYYRDKSKAMGYLAEEYKRKVNKKFNHIIHVGYLSEHMNKIGNDIDFLLLDTQHSLPGELFDFLAALPNLRNGAVVVLHDIFLNHESNAEDSFATRILLSSVVGKKIICKGNDNAVGYIGLGVFEVTEDTRKYIENVFSALMVTWKYMPDSAQIELYRRCLSKYYSDDLMKEFDAAVKLNRNTLMRKKLTDRNGFYGIARLIKELEGSQSIYIYGCGKFGRVLGDLLEIFGIEIKGYIISNNQTRPCIDKSVEYIDDVDVHTSTIVLGMSVANQQEVCGDSEYSNWIRIDENVLNFLKNYC